MGSRKNTKATRDFSLIFSHHFPLRIFDFNFVLFPVYSPRRSQSNIIPPDPNRLCVLPEKPHRKFSLISFRSSSSSQDNPVLPCSAIFPLPGIGSGDRKHILSTMKPSKESKKELYSLGFNQCYDCLTLTNFRYIAPTPPSTDQSNTSLGSVAVSFPGTSEETPSRCGEKDL